MRLFDCCYRKTHHVAEPHAAETQQPTAPVKPEPELVNKRCCGVKTVVASIALPVIAAASYVVCAVCRPNILQHVWSLFTNSTTPSVSEPKDL
jgi:hypothetical protein